MFPPAEIYGYRSQSATDPPPTTVSTTVELKQNAKGEWLVESLAVRINGPVTNLLVKDDQGHEEVQFPFLQLPAGGHIELALAQRICLETVTNSVEELLAHPNHQATFAKLAGAPLEEK